jgi:hypothetical protein
MNATKIGAEYVCVPQRSSSSVPEAIVTTMMVVTAMMVHRTVADAAVAVQVHPCGVLDGAEHRVHGRRAVVMHDLRRRSVVMCRRRGVGGAAVLWPAVLLPAVLWPAVLWAAVVVLGSVLVIHGPVTDAAIAVQVHACGIFDGADHGIDRWAGAVTEHTADAAVTVEVHSVRRSARLTIML